jgi:hypothetical protein
MWSETSKPLEVLKPAILPDDAWLFYSIFAVEMIGAAYGLIRDVPLATYLSLIVMGVIPGMPVFIHSIFHFTVRIELYEDRFTVVSFRPLVRFLKVGRRQQLAFKDISCVYYLEKEISFLKKFVAHAKKKATPAGFEDLIRAGIDGEIELPQAAHGSFQELGDDICKVFLKTKLNFSRYLRAENGPRGAMATARAKSYLVLSNRDGSQKVYLPNFYDLSGTDSRNFLRILKERNGDIQFLMDTRKIRRLFGSSEE